MTRFFAAALLISACSRPPPAELPLQFPEVPTGAAVSVFPGRLDFGALPAEDRALSIRNHTQSAIELRSLAFSSTAFSSATPMPMSIPALGSVEVIVHASGAGPLDGVLILDTSIKKLEVPLLANRLAPCLTTSRDLVDFGAVEVGCRGRDELIDVTNTCPHSVRIVGSESTGDFRMIAEGGGTLASGQSASFALSLVPSTAGATAGIFTVSADVLDGVQQVQVPLIGDATPTVVIEEVYPLRREERDVLFVIEDSPAMLAFSDTFRASLNLFVHQLNYDEDIRIAAMTTSTVPSELGRLRRTSTLAPWLDNPSFTALEEHLALTGSSMSRSSCLEALHAAFSTRTELALMLRPQAKLEVICVTSGADQLQDAPGPLITSLLSSMPRLPIVSVVGHFSTTASCGAPLDSGALRTFAEQTNGIRQEVCDPQWWLGEQCSDCYGYRTHYYLAQRPSFMRAPLEVSIDGVLVAEDPASWRYDPENNSVNFEPLRVPRPGQTLRFKYSPDCR